MAELLEKDEEQVRSMPPALGRLRSRVLGWTYKEINTGWEGIIVPQGATEMALALDDAELLNWASDWFDHQLDAGVFENSADPIPCGLRSGKVTEGIHLSDYCGCWGMAFVLGAILPVKAEERCRGVIVKVADYALDHSRRGKDGTILHGGFSNNIWVDTLYYCAPGFAAAYEVTGDAKYASAALEQCVLHAKHLRDEHTGLWHHDADPKKGLRTINYWGRGNGWIIAALADTLAALPDSTPGYGEVLELYRSLAESLFLYQHANGMWRVSPEDDESHLETSATSMILQGLAVGVREDWLEHFLIRRIRRGYEELLSWIDRDGRLLGSQSPAGRGDWHSLKLTPFGESTYTTGFMLRLAASLQQVEDRLLDGTLRSLTVHDA